MHAYDATHFEFAGNHAPCLEDFIFQHSPHAGELIGNRDLRQEEGSVESRCTTAPSARSTSRSNDPLRMASAHISKIARLWPCCMVAASLWDCCRQQPFGQQPELEVVFTWHVQQHEAQHEKMLW